MDLSAFHYICNFSVRLWENILESPLSWITIVLSVVSGAYIFGYYHANAQKDKEIAERTLENNLKNNELERKHKEETENLKNQYELKLKDRDKEADKWKEKYFRLMMYIVERNGRSP